jgi:hypothetical protein
VPTLKISNNSAANPQTVDLSPYLRLQPDQGADPYDPQYTEKVWGRSILREGATLALEQLREKEMVFPLALKGTTSSVVAGTLVQQINAVIHTPGATVSWQDDGMSQPTVFDLLSGQLDIEYSYFRSAGGHWTNAKLRLFTEPLGRTAGPRQYAIATAAGPVTYMAPSSYLARTPSPGNVVYPGNASLSGDAGAQLAIGYSASIGANQIGKMFVSLLPDSDYMPMSPSQIVLANVTPRSAATAPEGFVWTFGVGSANAINFSPIASFNTLLTPPLAWAGQHRLLAFARASGTWGQLSTAALSLISTVTTASVGPPSNAWDLYDLGTFSIRPSEPLLGGRGTNAFAEIAVQVPSVAGVGSNAALDIGGVIMLPDSTTWYVGPSANAENLIVIDDRLGDQSFTSTNGAPAFNPIGALSPANRLTPISRGLVPRPDPRNGLPILAFVAVGATPNAGGGALLPPYPQGTANVYVQERTRYVLP